MAHGLLAEVQPAEERLSGILRHHERGVDYFTHRDTDGELDFYEDETPLERIGYITDLITDRAVDYVHRRSADRQPFYLCLFYTAPHWPWEGPEDRAVSAALKELQHKDGGSLKTYASIVTRMDEGIGKVLAAPPTSHA